MKYLSTAVILIIIILAGIGMTGALAADDLNAPAANPMASAKSDLCPGSSHMWYGVIAMIKRQSPDLASQDIIKEWQAGASLAEVAAAHDVDANAIKDTIMAQTDSQLDAAVAANRMSEEKAEYRRNHVLTMLNWALTVTPDAL